MGGTFTYYLLMSISWIFSLLPLRGLYIFSDIAYFLVYHVVKYRKRTVYVNLSKSFPEKHPSELLKIEKNFYRFFCDSFFENLTLPFLSPRKVAKRFVYKNPEILEPYFQNKQGIILVMSHYANWEMTYQIPKHIKHEVFAAYKPLSNKGMDKFFTHTRERFGVKTVAMKNIARRFLQNIQDGLPTLVMMLSDQRPDRENVRYWTTFLDQDTPVLLGVEKLGTKFNLPVFFLDNRRTKRGYYEATFKLINDTPRNTREFEITENHIKYLEEVIKQDPAHWLWSHRRWKHRRIIDFLQMTKRNFGSPGVSYSGSIVDKYNIRQEKG
ncbi:MAG: lysophospholipid acyltransferase family protein [Bacteroidota bacterium]